MFLCLLGFFRIGIFADIAFPVGNSVGKLTINTLEKMGGKTIKALIEVVLSMMGAFLSNVVRQEVNRHCSCGKKMVLTKRNVPTRILSMFGYVAVARDMVFCRRCHKGHGVYDKECEMYGAHRITKGMTEIITYMSQLVPSFERGTKAIKKLLNIEVSPTQAQIISKIKLHKFHLQHGPNGYSHV